MSSTTPRRSSRIPHTPKMSERKKGLFQVENMSVKDSLTKHRRLPVVESESDSEECDLGIISTLDSSSGDEMYDQNLPKTPERNTWYQTRSHKSKILKESQDLKNFIKSPFTLNKYQTRYSNSEVKTSSTPATPHLQNHPGTPSSTHSCTSAYTTSSEHSKARKSLASLIADTESCSSSLKDLNFDTDSANDSKENTPTRRSTRKVKITPKFASFKGILRDQKKNISPLNSGTVTKLDKMDITSPSHILKTPHNPTDKSKSPPKLGHSRRSVIEIAESPEEMFDDDKCQKRLRDDSITSESGPMAKYPKLESTGAAPKARLSLFNSDRLKEILSAKSFYGKANPDLNTSVVTNKIATAVYVSTNNSRSQVSSHSNRQRARRPGQINMGVRHGIRKPKIHSKGKLINLKGVQPSYIKKPVQSNLNTSTVSKQALNDTSAISHNSSQEDLDTEKVDPFDSEKQTIEALLNQWTEEEVPESELVYSNRNKTNDLQCFNKSIMEETNTIFAPVTVTPVAHSEPIECDDEGVIVELGASNVHGVPEADFLPVDGGYIVVQEKPVSEPDELTDLDEIERELRMLDEQILKMAETNNMNPEAVLASTETPSEPALIPESSTSSMKEDDLEKSTKLFPIFNKETAISSPSTSKGTAEKNGKKLLLKSVADQYVIDAGQKNFGATQCNQCGVIYEIGDPKDEYDHMVHHNATDVLRFNGWKEECVVGAWGAARALRVRGGAAGWRRVRALLTRVVHAQLGYREDALPRDDCTYTAYLYIENKQIIGCLIVEPKVTAHKFIPGDPDCCSVETYPVKCGVSRVWTHARCRRAGVARRLLDAARRAALRGGGALRPRDLAFSAPTAAGRALAAAYCRTDNFYVYLD